MSNLIDNKANYKFSYGLFVLTTNYGKQSGCIINTAIQVTSDPLKVSIAINKNNYTLELIKNSKVFNISVISENAKFDLFKRFGFQSGRDVDKFENFPAPIAANGVKYVVDGTNAFFSCQVEEILDVGTHCLIVGLVTESKVLSDKKSATYEYYLNNIKPRPQSKKGDVYVCGLCGYEYIEAKEGTKFSELGDDWCCPLCYASKALFSKKETAKVYVCKVCGYEYDESKESVKFEDLPNDWVCPLCKHPKSDFELKQ